MIYSGIVSGYKKGEKKLVVLIDPDKIQSDEQLIQFIKKCEFAKTDYFFVGGSLMVDDKMKECIQVIRSNTTTPILLFPGSTMQINAEADALLFLSLISGRNAELLIGNQVVAAPYIKKSGLEAIGTGYILIDCGNPTTVSYISQTQPIPYNKPEIAACTAMAGEMLGMKMIYLDGGSGASKPISSKTISAVRKAVDVPLIVGGGIRSLEQANEAWDAGADLIVIGTAFEENADLLLDFLSRKKHESA